MKKIFYIHFAMQTILLSSAALVGQASAQNESADIPTHQAVSNLTNATSSPEDVKQMEVIGGTVNATLNASSAGGTNQTSYNTTGSWK
jgi:hypothetical protein